MTDPVKLEYVEISLEFSNNTSGELDTISAMCRSRQDHISEALMERLKAGNIVDGTLLLLVREPDGNELTFWVGSLYSHNPGRAQPPPDQRGAAVQVPVEEPEPEKPPAEKAGRQKIKIKERSKR